MLSGATDHRAVAEEAVMPTKEEDFKQRFAGVLLDMRNAAANDPEGMWLVGSLAARIIDEAKQPSWTIFKERISRADWSGLLTTFQTQGNALAKQGAQRQVFAVQVLAASMVAKTQTQDPDIVSGDKILSDIIDDAVTVFRDTQAADPIIS